MNETFASDCRTRTEGDAIWLWLPTATTELRFFSVLAHGSVSGNELAAAKHLTSARRAAKNH